MRWVVSVISRMKVRFMMSGPITGGMKKSGSWSASIVIRDEVFVSFSIRHTVCPRPMFPLDDGVVFQPKVELFAGGVRGAG